MQHLVVEGSQAPYTQTHREETERHRKTQRWRERERERSRKGAETEGKKARITDAQH